MSSEPTRSVLMNDMKKQNYWERKARSAADECALKMSIRTGEEKLRYVTNKMLPDIKTRIDDIKVEKKKSGSKTKNTAR